MTDLKPCPNCGSSEYPKVGGMNLNSTSGYRSVTCSTETKDGWKGCTMSGPTVHFSTRKPRDSSPPAPNLKEAKTIAIDAWNSLPRREEHTKHELEWASTVTLITGELDNTLLSLANERIETARMSSQAYEVFDALPLSLRDDNDERNLVERVMELTRLYLELERKEMQSPAALVEALEYIDSIAGVDRPKGPGGAVEKNGYRVRDVARAALATVKGEESDE